MLLTCQSRPRCDPVKLLAYQCKHNSDALPKRHHKEGVLESGSSPSIITVLGGIAEPHIHVPTALLQACAASFTSRFPVLLHGNSFCGWSYSEFLSSCTTHARSWSQMQLFLRACHPVSQEVLHALCDKNRKVPKRPSLVPPHGRHPPPELVILMQQCWHEVIKLCMMDLSWRLAQLHDYLYSGYWVYS